ncbi:hypothetical protein A6770_30230 [Nostoc minutum NIES-26]|uniref:Uncharacterized protein n=1 Tax=Nostoc minutum NIES-26 TaxID=1844469 RepID=A0A367QBN0_9NOSO|nr:hypothetical protein A6770_30230 [Nostoc minutum NIES-26]
MKQFAGLFYVLKPLHRRAGEQRGEEARGDEGDKTTNSCTDVRPYPAGTLTLPFSSPVGDAVRSLLPRRGTRR